MKSENLADIYELSPLQQGLLFHTIYAPHSGVYFEQFSWTLQGNLDVAAFERAWQRVIDRHPILRTAFYWQELEKPYQVVYARVPLPWNYEDWQSIPENEQKQKIDAFLRADRQQGFDLTQAPLIRLALFKLAKDTYQFVWSSHHLLLDGWSESLVFQEVYACYQAFSAGKEVVLERSRPYRDYITWLQQQDLKRAETFWRKQLQGFTHPTVLKCDRAPNSLPSQGEEYDWQRIELSEAATASLQNWARQNQLTLNTLIQGAWTLLLSRYSGESDILFGSTSSGRPAELKGVESMVGLFVNTLPMRVKVSPSAFLIPWLQELQATQIETLEYEYSPLVRVQGWSDLERGLPLFEIGYVLENYPVDFALSADEGGIKLSNSQSFEKTNEALSLLAVPDASLRLELWYDTRRFDREIISQMLGHLQVLLGNMTASSNMRLAELSMLCEGEKQLVLTRWSQNPAPLAPEHLSILDLFASRVRETPEAIALVWQGERLTYAELNRSVNLLAASLIKIGVKTGDLIGICLERSIEMAIAPLAVMKAGAAYLPLDPAYPSQRLAFMLSDAQASLLLTQDSLLAKLPETEATTVTLSQLREMNPTSCTGCGQCLEKRHNPLAYLVYTSGSTGNPKGVMVSHRSLVNAYYGWEKAYKLQNTSSHLQMASFAFDVFTGDLIRALCSGKKLVICPRDFLLEPHQLYALMVREGIDCAEFVPAVARNLVRYLQETEQRLDFMKVLICGSDSWYLQEAATLRDFSPSDARIINSFGVTEATIDSSYFELPPHLSASPSLTPIGRPLANVELYILDSDLQPVPAGVPGELYLGGEGLAWGYYQQPELTAAKFVPHPYSQRGSDRLYRTGDLALWGRDGNVEFLGRVDNQAKIRGYRLELAEIEANLVRHPGVKGAVVVTHLDASGENSLVAYIAGSLKGEDAAKLEAEQISQWQLVYDSEAENFDPASDRAFNIYGWNSSYTGEPIPAIEMREWVDATVERILALNPDKVLEIGCGTGLLLFPIAPHCSAYQGIDFSEAALGYIQQVLDLPQYNLPQVTLRQSVADEIGDIKPSSCDTVIINSVIQYFPSQDYLLRVLSGAIAAVKPGGNIFIGDVRSLPLLEAFHASIALHRADDSASVAQLQQQIQNQMQQEEELVISPSLFTSLTQHFPQIERVQILPKRGDTANELTKFRYDIILGIGSPTLSEYKATDEIVNYSRHLPVTASPRPQSTAIARRTINWQPELSLAAITELLASSELQILEIRGIPNSRVEREVKLLEILKTSHPQTTVAELKQILRGNTLNLPAPEAFWTLAASLPYHLEISWASGYPDGSYDQVFSHKSLPNAPSFSYQCDRTSEHLHPRVSESPRPLPSYTNNPLQSKLNQQSLPQLREYLQQRLPEYAIPSHFVWLEELPLTPNGKLDRKALPSPDLTRSQSPQDTSAPQQPVTEMLSGIWSQVLGVKHVAVEDNFFELGGHSLLATQVISRIREVFRVDIPLRTLFETPTIAALSQAIKQQIQSQTGSSAPPLVRVGQAGELPLSFAQQRMWLADRLVEDKAAYNDPVAVKIKGKLNVNCLERAINEIIRRHEVLRTGFSSQKGQPVQVIAPRATISLPIVDYRNIAESERDAIAKDLIERQARDKFDLPLPPLIRSCLIWLDEEEYLLSFILHHIVSDGWSMGVLLSEVKELYGAFSRDLPSPLPELEIQYADFAIWQRQCLQGEVLEQQLVYWRDRLAGLPSLRLPFNRDRSSPSRRGATVPFSLDAKLTNGLKQLSQQEGVTLFMTLLAAFQTLLYCYTKQTDFGIGSPIANRDRKEIENLIGFFVNTLVLRADLSLNPSFRELLGRVREVTLGAYSHQDLPFEKLVAELQPQRQTDALPLFNVWFVLQNTPLEKLEMSGITLEPVELHTGTSEFDFALFIDEVDQGLSGCFEYNPDLCDRSTVAEICDRFASILQEVIRDKETTLSDLFESFESEIKQSNYLESERLAVANRDRLISYKKSKE